MADILAARQAGILLPISSLPSRHGIGDMGPGAHSLLPHLAKAGVRVWQILPLNPLFCAYLMKLLGSEREPAYFEAAMNAYEQRVKEFSDPNVVF